MRKYIVWIVLVTTFFMASCSDSAISTPDNQPTVSKITDDDYELTFVECVAIPLEASNLKCSFDIKNLRNTARDWSTGRGFAATLTDGKQINPNNMSIGSGAPNTSVETRFSANDTQRINVFYLFPGGTSKISQLDIDTNGCCGGGPNGRLEQLPITGTIASSKPNNGTNAGIYEFFSDDYRLRFQKCEPVTLPASNLQCDFTIYNLRSTARSHQSYWDGFKISLSGASLNSENVAYASQKFSETNSITFAPNSPQTLIINFTVPAGTTLIPQLDIDTNGCCGAGPDGTLYEIPITGSVIDPQPDGAIGSGVYQVRNGAYKLKFTQCSIVTNLQCQFNLVNLNNTSRNHSATASNFVAILDDGTTVRGSQLAYSADTFSTSASTTFSANESKVLTVTFPLVRAITRIPQLDIETNGCCGQGPDGTMRDLPVN